MWTLDKPMASLSAAICGVPCMSILLNRVKCYCATTVGRTESRTIEKEVFTEMPEYSFAMQQLTV